MPRFLPDGQRNSVRLERLKDKLGNRSEMPGAEVEFQDASRLAAGRRAKGIRHILRMGGMTRLDCALGSHGLMRRAFSVAIYHAHQRSGFGKPLIEQPLMRQIISRMALCTEGQTALYFGWRARTGATSRAKEGIMGAIIHASGEIRHL